MHDDFLVAIWRISVGTLALASPALQAMYPAYPHLHHGRTDVLIRS